MWGLEKNQGQSGIGEKKKVREVFRNKEGGGRRVLGGKQVKWGNSVGIPSLWMSGKT